MTFIARYMHRRHEQPEYWRMVSGDDLREAQDKADRMARKGFICVSIKQQQGKD